MRRRDRTRLDDHRPHFARRAAVLEFQVGYRHRLRAGGLVAEVGDFCERHSRSGGDGCLIASRHEQVQQRQPEEDQDDGRGDHEALSLPRVLDDAFRRRDFTRAEDFLKHGFGVDGLLTGTRVRSAVRAEPCRCVNVVPAGAADSFGHGLNDMSTVKGADTGWPFSVAGLKRHDWTAAISSGV